LLKAIASNPRTLQILYYSVPSFFSKGISLILFPLFASRLTVSEFGHLELIQLFGTFLQYVFHFGWSSAYVRFYKEQNIANADLTVTLLSFRFIVASIILLVFFLLGPVFLSTTITRSSEYGIVLVGVVFAYLLREFLLFYETRYRVEEQTVRFVLLNIAVALLQFVLIITLFVYLSMGIAGIVWGQVIALAFVSLALLLADGRWLVAGMFRPQLLRRSILFGLPLVPAALAMLVIIVSDRYMLNWLLPDTIAAEQVGYYAFGFKFVMILTLLTSGFSTFWAPYVYQTYERPDSQTRFSFIFVGYGLTLFFCMMALLGAIPFLIKWFEHFRPALDVIPLLMAGFLIYQIGDYFSVGIGIKEQTHIRAKAGVVTILINLVLNFLLIPMYGMIGAAVATFISYAVYVGILMIASHRLFPIPYAVKLWILAVVTVASASYVSTYLSDLLIFYLLATGITVSALFVHAGLPYLKNYGVWPRN